MISFYWVRGLKNVFVERFQRKLGCGATVTRFRETVFDEDAEVEFEHGKRGVFFKDRLWDEES